MGVLPARQRQSRSLRERPRARFCARCGHRLLAGMDAATPQLRVKRLRAVLQSVSLGNAEPSPARVSRRASASQSLRWLSRCCRPCLAPQVRPFSSPKIELEQYHTAADLAARILLLAQSHGDVAGRTVVDLGCGTAMLAIAARACGAGVVIGVDTDADALADAASNLRALEMEDGVDLVHSEVGSFCRSVAKRPRPAGVHTVITNPPFGTRTAGADVAFLEAAAALQPQVIYSLHKTSTRAFLLGRAEEMGYHAEAVAEMAFPLPKAYAFHRKSEGSVAVDLLRLTRAPPAAATAAAAAAAGE